MVHTSWKSIDAAMARCFMAPPSFMIRGRVACLLIYLTAWLISKTLSSMLHTAQCGQSRTTSLDSTATGMRDKGEGEEPGETCRQSLIVLDLWPSLIWPATRVDTSSSALSRSLFLSLFLFLSLASSLPLS